MNIGWSGIGQGVTQYRVYSVSGAQTVRQVAEYAASRAGQPYSVNVSDDPRLTYWITAERADGTLVAQASVER